MGVTAAVVGAVTAVAGTTASVEAQAQARRAAGQAAVGQKQMATDAATKDQMEKDKKMQQAATAAMSDESRQRAAISGDVSTLKGGTLLTGYSQAPSISSGGPVSGGKTLLGS